MSPEGMEGGYFLGAIDVDLVQVSSGLLEWSMQSASYERLREIALNPLMSALGPLSRLIAHAVENTRDPSLVSQTTDVLANFARTMTVQWRLNKLSTIDAAEEKERVHAESRRSTIPQLWKVLRNCFYSVVIVLRSVLGRLINDYILAADRRELRHG